MKKRILSFILAVVMIVSMIPLSAIPVFSAEGEEETPTTYIEYPNEGGGDTSDKPWAISTLAQLESLADAVNDGNSMEGKYFVLTADIGDSTNGFTKVIGNNGKPFKGHFDGQEHTVTLNINKPEEDWSNWVGLFGYIGEGATISNVNTAGSVVGYKAVGGICGWNNEATISNCHNSADVTGYIMVGGICGYNNETISNCSNSAKVTGTANDVGGISGVNHGTISNCSNSAKVTGKSYSVGGISGDNSGTIYNCYNSADVTGTGDDVGGICGYNNGGTISNCSNSGIVSGKNNQVGGICGYNNGGTIYNCYNSGSVSGNGNVGGICGDNDGTISDCYYDNTEYTGNTIGTGLTTEKMKATPGTEGALVDLLNGYREGDPAAYPSNFLTWAVGAGEYPSLYFEMEGSGTEKDPYVITKLTQLEKLADEVNKGNTDYNSKYYVLGADIYNFTKVIGNTFFNSFDGHFDGRNHTITLNIPSDSNTFCVGLFGSVGYNSNTAPTISNVKTTGSVKNTENGAFVGSICGYNFRGTIYNCYNSADVTGTTGAKVGGICGYNSSSGTIYNCSNSGSVSGNNQIGGICGNNSGTIYNCSNSGSVVCGSVNGNSSVGGICGYNSGTIYNCNNSGSVSGTGVNVGGICGDIQNGTIYNCSNSAEVLGNDSYVGGICGRSCDGVTLSNCYNIGNVSGKDSVGGICGYIYGYNNAKSTISNCYSSGTVTGNSLVGGVYGDRSGVTIIVNCYYESENDTDESEEVTGLTQTKMQAKAGTDGALVDRLNAYLVANSTANAYVWDVKEEKYPHLVQFVAAKTDDAVYETATSCFDILGNGYTLEWKNGEEWNGTAPAGVSIAGENDFAKKLSTSDNTPAGSYTFRLTSAEYTTEYTLVIAPYKVTKPTANATEYIYNKEEQTYTPVGFDTVRMTITGNKKTNAGDHTATVSLVNSTNYTWDDGSTEPITIEWKINKADLPDEEKIKDFCMATTFFQLPDGPEGVSYSVLDSNFRKANFNYPDKPHLIWWNAPLDTSPLETTIKVSSKNYEDYEFTVTRHTGNTFGNGTYTFGQDSPTSNGVSYNEPIVISGNNVIFIIPEGAVVNANKGIVLTSGNTLTLSGEGTLNAKGERGAAGIGGSFMNYNAGTLIINGGTVNAEGGIGAAGIGGGFGGNGGTVTINGGTVTAKGGLGNNSSKEAAGIGGGYAGECGTVIINNIKKLTTTGYKGLGAGKDSKLTSNITVNEKLIQKTSTAADGEETVVIIPDIQNCNGASLTLGSDIYVNFYMDLIEEATMTFTVKGVEKEAIKKTTENGTCFSCPINALEMNELITATFNYGKDNHEVTYSVAQYIEKILNDSDSETMKTLAKKIANYGHYAQSYLANIHSSVKIGVEGGYKAMEAKDNIDVEAAAKALEDYSLTVKTNAKTLSLYGSTVYFDSATALNYYVKSTTGKIPTATCEGKNVTVTEYTGYKSTAVEKVYIVSVKDIFANELAKDFVVNVTCDDNDGNSDTLKITGSVFAYCNSVMTAHSGKTEAKDIVAVNAMAALYEYYAATEIYSTPKGE